MNGVIFTVVVILVIVSKIREAIKSNMPDRSSGLRSLSDGAAGSASADSFSLQNVLAEIQKVKDQAERADGMSASEIRERIQPRTISDQKRKELAERASKRRESLRIETAPTGMAAGPMGRGGTAPQAPDPSPEQGLRSAPAGAAVPVTPQATPQSVNNPSRITAAQLRDGALWREILSPPLSLRDE